MKIVFLRHGESMGNAWHHAYQSDQTNFLTAKGRLEADVAGHNIMRLHPARFDLVACSEALRARQTLNHVLQVMDDWRRQPIISGDLNEWGHPRQEGLHSGPDADWKAHRESEEEFIEHVRRFIGEYIQPYLHEDVSMLVVSHYYTQSVLMNEINAALGHHEELGSLDSLDLSAIPNAIPYYVDTFEGGPIQMIGPGYFSLSR